jgi:PAS domain S-box-containing protein
MGTAVRAFGTIQDITERKRAEEELRESEEFNTSLLNNSPNPIVVINPDTSVRYVNPALKELTGFSSAEIIGRKAPYPWWTEETLKKTSRDLEEAMRKGANKVEELFQKKNGERFWVEITSTPVKSKGELKYYLANWVDITERKRAEEKIRAEKEFSERLIVTANAIIVGLDQEHRIQLFSEGAERITGYKAEEVMGKDWFEIFFKKEMYPEIIKVWNNAWGKDLSSYTNPIYSKTGKEIIAQWSNTTIVDDKKEPILLLCIAVDITEQKKMEAQLIQSERLSAVGTLAYGIAHEFNNILAGILGNAEFGMGNDDPKEVEKCFRIIMESCDRAAGITNSLLAFSRQRQAKRGKADVTEVVETVLDLTERELEKQNIKVVRKFKPIPEITCDLGELSGVVLNMITNARDAMKPDGGTLTIEIGKKKDNIEIIFTDTGCGIPDSIKSRIFEPFVTTKGALGQSEIPGTGLGLFLSYGIISRYHGKIGVKSEEGKGSTFTIKIPISKNQESPVLFEPEEEKPTAVPQNLNILLVDDEEPICTAVKKFFENKGHSVTTALSGKKGYEIFKKGSFDLVLADITMPDMDGVELISQLKKIDQQVKFIVLTGHIAEEKLESAKKAGADEILMKPFRNEELYQTIGKVLSV